MSQQEAPEGSGQSAGVSDEYLRETASPLATRKVLMWVGALLAAVAVFFAGWFIGRPTWPGDLSTDAGFARDMQLHHGQAVDMSLIVRSAGTANDVQTLAYDIATTQENQRGEMRGWLETWGLSQARAEDPMEWMKRSGHQHSGGKPMLQPDGRMQGMASAGQLDQLRSARGKDAEVIYLQLMIPHHRAGVDMASACVSSCTEPNVVDLAKKMVAGQKSEINLMISMLRKRDAVPPAP
ncbi:DUF305 domain-containing protein [Demetria terragena]|uniref:DUF305 domain-containing protein n=1 Tax=Demetria terragena TaxID=63959 RepID=UPI00036FA586|nr:DUF305 domain-containing protein [Demetria terragena]